MSPSNESKIILLVEDQAIIALAEKQLLEDSGYQVLLCYDGNKAVDLALGEETVDLILMDIDLGRGMDGTEAADRILQERDLPVVFLSSHTEPEVVERTEGISSYGYIYKSAGQEVLLASIRMAFRLFEARESLKRELQERRRVEAALSARNENLAALLEVSRSLSSSLDLQTVLQTASDGLARISGLNSAAVYLLRGDAVELRAATPSLPPGFPEKYRLAALEYHPHLARAIRTGQPVHIYDTRTEELTAEEEEIARSRGLRSIFYHPLNSGTVSIGALITGTTEGPIRISESNDQLCSTLSNIAAVAAENAIQFERVSALSENSSRRGSRG